MPEGHTIHRIARAWRPLIGRHVRTSSPQGRFAEGARRRTRVLGDRVAYACETCQLVP